MNEFTCPPPNHFPIIETDIINASKSQSTPIDERFTNAKFLLQQCSSESGDSLYNHISEIIKRVLDQNPPNVIDYFEEYSRNIRKDQSRIKPKYLLEDVRLVDVARLKFAKFCIKSINNSLANKMIYQKNIPEIHHKTNNFIQMQGYWKQFGLGLTESDTFLIASALNKFKENPNFSNAKFWGKLFGTTKSYFIIELEIAEKKNSPRPIEEEEEQEPEELQNSNDKRVSKNLKEIESETQSKEKKESLNEVKNLNKKIPEQRKLMKNEINLFPRTPLNNQGICKAFSQVAPIPRPAEDTLNSSAENNDLIVSNNRYTYFVCNKLTENWTELPPITKDHMKVFRLNKRFMTGNLEYLHPVYSKSRVSEKFYLRTIIEVISNETHLAPNSNEFGYKVELGNVGTEEEGDEEEVEEEDTNRENNIKPVLFGTSTDLLDIRNWVNYKTSNVNNNKDSEVVQNDSTSLVSLDFYSQLSTPSPWNIRLLEMGDPDNKFIFIKSNNWKGAFTLAINNEVYDNLYMGFGVKASITSFSPPPVPHVQKQYKNGPEITTINDPTVEEEDALKYYLEEKLAFKTNGEVGEKESDDEGEEEEDEDNI